MRLNRKMLRQLVAAAMSVATVVIGLIAPGTAANAADCSYSFPGGGYPNTRQGLQDRMDAAEADAACSNVIITMTSDLTMDATSLSWTSTAKDFTLRGTVTITGTGSEAVMNVDVPAGRTVTVDGLTIRNGQADGRFGNRDYGGAIYSGAAGSLVVSNATFVNNDADGGYGGAIASDGRGDLTVSNSSFTNNGSSGVSQGGAIYWEGDVTISSSRFSGNEANEGGAVFADSTPTIEISNSSFTDNQATGTGSEGGAILATNGSALSIRGSTFSRNSADEFGGAIAVYGSAEVLNSTLTDNSATLGFGGIFIADDQLTLDFVTLVENSPTNVGSNGGAPATVRGSVVGLSAGGSNCDVEISGTPIALPLVATFTESVVAPGTDTSCGSDFLAAAWSELALGSLANNGGTTQTMLPGPSSILIDLAADPTVTVLTTVDQRGFARSGAYTVGAVQYGVTAPEADLSQVPPSWLQAYQRGSRDEVCLPGWHPSWALWPNGHTGGWTCERRIQWSIPANGWIEEPGFS